MLKIFDEICDRLHKLRDMAIAQQQEAQGKIERLHRHHDRDPADEQLIPRGECDGIGDKGHASRS